MGKKGKNTNNDSPLLNYFLLNSPDTSSAVNFKRFFQSQTNHEHHRNISLDKSLSASLDSLDNSFVGDVWYLIVVFMATLSLLLFLPKGSIALLSLKKMQNPTVTTVTFRFTNPIYISLSCTFHLLWLWMLSEKIIVFHGI
ncbi:unnamed protein product [Lactuca saligna]|uniref:Uncharacterized protein n=1 Tax=Lactuca saligna TaxID=75948 RepID=A0AA35VN55_LACSI|nr:unnamed protein product [Lactuca saligna]